MRNLADWLGHIVVITGTVCVVQDHRFCMERVRITQYSDAPEIRIIDHLWVYLTPEEVVSCAELRKNEPRLALKEGRDVGFVGNVVEYRRRDGSKDYAIKSNGHTARALSPLSGNYDDIRFLPAEVRLDYLLDMFQSLKKRLVWFNFERISYSGFMEEVRKAIAHVRHELDDLELTRVRIKQSLSHRKGNVRPDPIKFKSKELVQAKGFSR